MKLLELTASDGKTLLVHPAYFHFAYRLPNSYDKGKSHVSIGFALEFHVQETLEQIKEKLEKLE